MEKEQVGLNQKPGEAAKDSAPANNNKCTVCHKVYCEPKLLPCGHLMCRKCLLSWLKQTRHATCPYCRYPILKDDENRQATPVSQCKGDNPTEGDQGCEDVDDEELQELVDSFPTEQWMASLVKAEKLLHDKQKCHVCEEQATSICLQCGDTLCASCKNMHTKFTISNHHEVEELSRLTAERLADFQPPTQCPVHPKEPLRIFCTQHATSLCILCAYSSHRTCPQITEIEQFEQARVNLAEMINFMTGGSAEIEGAMSELDQHLADIEQRTENTLADIQTLKERLNKAVEECCQRLKQQICAAREDIREAVREAKVILQGRQSRLGSHSALAQRVLSSSDRDVVCAMTSVMAARLKDIDRRLDKPYGSKIITTAELIVDDNAVLRVEEELAKLGSLNVQFTQIAANAYEVFHHNHGKDITLSNGDKTAACAGDSNYRAVLVRKPLAVGDLVEVEMDLFTGESLSPIALGITCTDPDSIVLHEQSYIQIPRSSTVTSFCVYINGIAKFHDNGPEKHLKSVKQGAHVGVLRDHNHKAHLYIDGRDCGVFVAKVAPPCYALFHMNGFPTQVTLLPRRKIER